MIYLTGARLPAAQEFKVLDEAWEGKRGEGQVEVARPVVTNAKASSDDLLVEDYIKFGAITKKNGRGGKPLNSVREKQARSLWDTFKRVVDKPMKDCGYDDAVKLVAHIEAEHLKNPASRSSGRRWIGCSCRVGRDGDARVDAQETDWREIRSSMRGATAPRATLWMDSADE